METRVRLSLGLVPFGARERGLDQGGGAGARERISEVCGEEMKAGIGIGIAKKRGMMRWRWRWSRGGGESP